MLFAVAHALQLEDGSYAVRSAEFPGCEARSARIELAREQFGDVLRDRLVAMIAAGEWCCGENDCESPEQIASTGLGWVVNGGEFVPFNEATPSPDGKLWICRRADKTRRCVFGPPPNS